MHLIVLHGAVGIWDEIACLALPATVILGVALALLREKPVGNTPPTDAAAPGHEEETTTSARAAQGERP